MRLKKKFANTSIVLLSILFSLLCLELGVRLSSPFPTFSVRYPIGLHLNELTTSQPHVFDLNLGYRHKPGYYHEKHPNFGGLTFTSYRDGTRSNLSETGKYFAEKKFLQPNFNQQKSVIATGDSFTSGNEVGNNQTWPAILEKISEKRVVNGGVGGYSIIQSTLIAEQLAKHTGINRLIISIIPDDIERAEHSIYQGVPRPYYSSSDSNLIIYYNHIENITNFSKDDVNSMKEHLDNYGRSFLLMEILRRIYIKPEVFYYFGFHKKENIDGSIIGCKLMERLNKFSKDNNAKIAILFQYPDYYFYKPKKLINVLNKVAIIKKCAINNDLFVLDMYESLEEVFRENIKSFEELYVDRNRHMSKIGNLFVANFIQKNLFYKWF